MARRPESSPAARPRPRGPPRRGRALWRARACTSTQSRAASSSRRAPRLSQKGPPKKRQVYSFFFFLRGEINPCGGSIWADALQSAVGVSLGGVPHGLGSWGADQSLGISASIHSLVLWSGPYCTTLTRHTDLPTGGRSRPLRLYEAEPPRRCGSGIPLIRDHLLPRVGKQVVDGAPVEIPIHRKWATAAEDSLCRQTATVTR